MRWMWIDKIVEFVPETRMVAVKNVSLAEDHLHDHFGCRLSVVGSQSPADTKSREPKTKNREPLPVMPASLMIEGMAQTAGILVGSVNRFREKVILAKVVTARFEREVFPGQTIQYDATIDRIDKSGAVTRGIVRLLDHGVTNSAWQDIGIVDLMFSHIDQNMAGLAFPEENFVFSDNFRTLLNSANLSHLAE